MDREDAGRQGDLPGEKGDGAEPVAMHDGEVVRSEA